MIPLRLTVAASVTDAGIQNKIFGSHMITLIISNKEMVDIMIIIKSLEKFGLLIKGVAKQLKIKQKNNKKVDFSVCY